MLYFNKYVRLKINTDECLSGKRAYVTYFGMFSFLLERGKYGMIDGKGTIWND